MMYNNAVDNGPLSERRQIIFEADLISKSVDKAANTKSLNKSIDNVVMYS